MTSTWICYSGSLAYVIGVTAQKFRSFTRWTQFVAMLTAQLSGRCSLRDEVDSLAVQGQKLYRLGIKAFSRATLVRFNENQSHTPYGELFQRLLGRCQSLAPRNKKFKLKVKIYLLDAALLDLTLSLFPWAKYQKTKGAAKLHVGLDADGNLPAFVDLTADRERGINLARTLALPRSSMWYLIAATPTKPVSGAVRGWGVNFR